MESSSSSSSRKQTIDDSAWDEAVNEWVNTSLRNTSVSQSTEAWNHIMTELPKLRKLLESKI